ncbi:PAS domain S-box protein [bacterium]|nr:PAS domain S-box protein [bacterium]
MAKEKELIDSELQQRLRELEQALDKERTARAAAEMGLENAQLIKQQNEQLRWELEQTKSDLAKALSDSETRLKSILRHSTDIIYELNHEGVLTSVQGGVAHILGYTEEELKGKHFYDYLKEEYKEEIYNFYADCIAQNRIKSYKEVPLISKQGAVVWLGQNVQLLFDGDDFLGAFVVARNITEQRNIAEQREIERTRLSNLIKNMQQAILMEDEHRRILLTNDKFCHLFGIPASADHMVGVDCSDAAEQSKHLFQEPEAFVKGVEKIITERKLVAQEYLKMVDGTILMRDYVPIFHQERYLGHLWIYNDITKLEEQEYLLRENELKYSSVLENLELGILEVDNNDVVTKVFPKFETLVEYSADELVGKRASDILVDAEQKKITDAANVSRQEDVSSAYEITIIAKSGRKKHVLISGAPIKNSRGEVTGSMGIHFDITEMKNLENYLRKAKQEADEARRAEQNFTARMSHEVRTPLTALQGTLALLEGVKSKENFYSYIKSARLAADHLRSLVDDVLDYNKIKAGKVNVHAEAFELRTFLESIVQNFKVLADDKGLEFITLLSNDLPFGIISDKKIIYQILTNLLSNALKFTRAGFVGINVKCEAGKDNKCRFVIDVFDSGIGIDAKDREVIFNDYGRAANVETHFEGTGLGLGIVKGLVGALNGSLSLESTPEKGSCFTVSFVASAINELSLQKREVAIDENKKVLTNLLVVDDAKQIRDYIKNIMQPYEVSLALAANGNEAIEMLSRGLQPDLVLIDYRMPHKDGFETTRALRALGYKRPVYIMSATPIDALRVDVNAVAIDKVISKPFLPVEFIAHISEKFSMPQHAEPTLPQAAMLIPELNSDEMRAIYGNNKKYLFESISTFLAEVDSNFSIIFDALSKANYNDLEFLVHKIKPSMSMVNLSHLSNRLAAVELEIKSGEALDKVAIELEEVYKEVLAQKPILAKQQKYLTQNV